MIPLENIELLSIILVENSFSFRKKQVFLMKGKYLPIYMTFHQFYCDFFNWQNFVSSVRGVTGRNGARRGATGRNRVLKSRLGSMRICRDT